jgi:hypothetical protein
MFLRLPKWLIVLVVFFVCSDLQAQNCIDKNATKLTKNLYKNLSLLSEIKSKDKKMSHIFYDMAQNI